MIGLGNPGRRYERTRHNLGFRVVDRVVPKTGADREDGGAAYVAWRSSGRGLLLVKPTTFMNASGEAVAEIVGRESVGRDRLLVICDDVNLPLGRIRLRAGGSAGGHNGLLSVGLALDGTEFPRLRMGVGPKPAEAPLRDFVLGDFAPEELEEVEAMVERAADAAVAFAERGIEAAMREFNTKGVSEEG